MRIESPWTRKMNKKQYGKTASNKRQQRKPLCESSDLFKSRQEKLRTDRFLWRVGFVIITLVLALGVWMIWAVATL